MKKNARLRCLAAALACTASLALWQTSTVRYTYGGNWTGLFCIGAFYTTLPPQLQSEQFFIFPNHGYDGQQYHLIAHDPLFRRGLDRYLDGPRVRYRRILVPGLAAFIAFGQDRAVDTAYVAVQWLFFFAGAYWLGRFAVSNGYSAWLGFLFSLVPAVLISADRQTVDAALAACCVGFAWYTRASSPPKLYAVLALAALVRETGWLLLVAYVIWLAAERRLREAILFSTAALPAAAWYAFVHAHTEPDHSTQLTPALFSGIAARVMHPFPYPSLNPVTAAAAVLDLLALAAIAFLIVWTIRRAALRVWTPCTVAIYLFAVLAAAMPAGDLWSEVYAFGRSLTPLLLLAALEGLSIRSVLPLSAMLALDPRIGLQMAGQIVNIVRGLTGL